jgi:hypothetical protein
MPLFLALSGCGGDDDGGGADDGDGASPDASGSASDAAAVDAAGSEFAVDIVQRTCAPNDGPAVTLSLGGAYDPETCTIDFDARSVVISVFLDEWEVTAPDTFRFDAEDLRGVGQFCPGGDGACRDASAGELHVETWSEGEGASGTWQITMGDDSMSGAFAADWCDPEGGGPYCG